ncbi:hypothetical protein R3P38DRAFT_3438822 [Favolaschia claudopus]|uniref:Uncharacterized protein n=1 Tax=Favolaschia claudopus TaxID=2862362 RepID=A0AAV9ZRI1_9AGAR
MFDRHGDSQACMPPPLVIFQVVQAYNPQAFRCCVSAVTLDFFQAAIRFRWTCSPLIVRAVSSAHGQSSSLGPSGSYNRKLYLQAPTLTFPIESMLQSFTRSILVFRPFSPPNCSPIQVGIYRGNMPTISSHLLLYSCGSHAEDSHQLQLVGALDAKVGLVLEDVLKSRPENESRLQNLSQSWEFLREWFRQIMSRKIMDITTPDMSSALGELKEALTRSHTASPIDLGWMDCMLIADV